VGLGYSRRAFLLSSVPVAGSLLGLNARPHRPSVPGPSGMVGRWILTFNDEFRGTDLNQRLWNTQYPWGADNNDDGSQNCYLPGNVTLDGKGHLALTGRRGTVRGTTSDGKPTSWPFSSGQINTFGKFSLRSGAVEIRAKVPTGPGVWPAFWALPADGSWPPEVDFMEVYDGAVHTTFHPRGTQERGRSYTRTTRPRSSMLSDSYHVFGCALSPEAITWYLDGRPQWSFNDRTAIAGLPPLYIVCNLAIGGIGGDPTVNTWPRSYLIDYVRAWRRIT